LDSENSKSTWAWAVAFTALTAFLMGGLPYLIKSRAATRGYDYAEKLSLATAEAYSRERDAQLLSVGARYVDNEGRVVFPDFRWGNSVSTIKWNSSVLVFEFQSLAGAKPATQVRLGAPVAERGSPCSIIRLAYSPAAGWLTGHSADVTERTDIPDACRSIAGDALPRCTMAQIWGRAIAAGAPHPALAGISATNTSGRFVWSFSINDQATGKSAFSRSFQDDCSPPAGGASGG
jgi:hypothetical protein